MRKFIAEVTVVAIAAGYGIGIIPMFGSAQQAPLPDMVLRWNQVALDAQMIDHTPGAGVPGAGLKREGGPTMTARSLAMMHGAIYDAVNSIDQTHTPYLLTSTFPQSASMEAAIAQAGHDILASLYPEQAASFDADLTHDLGLIADGQSKTDGIAAGTAAAAAMLAARTGDGDNGSSGYVSNPNPGYWWPDPLHPNQTPYADYYGTVKPFIIPSAADFAAPATPALNSPEYTAAYNEVKSLGAKNSTTRTAEQTQIGIFWGYDGSPGIGVPPKMFNQITRTIADQQGNNEVENARLFALVNLAQADGGISAWKAKYDYNFWRPVTAIRESDPGTGHTGLGDGNDDTIGDPAWEPLGAPASNPQLSATPDNPPTNFTPPFPAYTSGHATFGAATMRMLADYYGRDDIHFTVHSEEFNGVTRDQDGSVRPVVTRSFTSFTQASDENAQSRIYLGIHWAFDRDEGKTQGRNVADYVFAHFATPLPTTDLGATAAAPALAIGGTPFTATVGVKNFGLIDAHGAVVTTAIPADFAFDAQASDQRCTLGQGNVVSCAVGGESGLAPQANATFTLHLTASTELCSTTATLVTSVDASEADGNLSNNIVQSPIFVGCPTEGQVQLKAALTGSDRVFRGDDITYQLNVTNDGPGTAPNVRATLAGLTLSSGGNPAECSQVGADIVCGGFALSSGSNRSFTVKAATSLESQCPRDVTTTAAVTSDAEDFYTADNLTASVVTHVECEPVADMAINTFTGPSGAGRGETVTYTAIAKNFGPATASNVVVSLPLPAGVTFQSGSAGCAQNGTAVECTLQSLGVNATHQFDVTFQSLPSFECGASVSVGASVTAHERDTEPGNNQSNSVNTTITCDQGGGTTGGQGDDESSPINRAEVSQSHSHKGHGTTEAAMVMSFLAHNHNIQITDNSGQDSAQAHFVGHFAFASDASRVFALKMDPFGLRRAKSVAFAPYTKDEISVICGMKDYLHQDAHINRMNDMMPWVIEKLSSMLHRQPDDVKAALEGEDVCK